MKTILKDYSNINELIKAVEERFRTKVIDGWQVGKSFYCVLPCEINHTKEPNGKWNFYVQGGLKIQVKMPI